MFITAIRNTQTGERVNVIINGQDVAYQMGAAVASVTHGADARITVASILNGAFKVQAEFERIMEA